MTKLFLAGALGSALVFAQEKTETVQTQRGGKTPPASFQKDPQQSRLEATTQIVTNSSKGTPAGSQTENSSVDNDLRQRVLVALSTGSVGTQGVIATDQLTDIKVAVTNRTVTLRGDVISEKNKQSIGKRIAGLDGVSKVNNQLTVNPKAKPARADLVKPDGYSPGKQNDPGSQGSK